MKNRTLSLLLLSGLLALHLQASPLAAQEYPNAYELDTISTAPPAPDVPLIDPGSIGMRGSGGDDESIAFVSGDTPDLSIEADGMEEDTPTEAAPSTSGGSQSYTVRKGDTLGSISRKFFGTTKYWKKIASANGISNPASLKVGRVLRIPALGKGVTKRVRKTRTYRAPAVETPVETPPALQLPPVSGGNDQVLYSDKGLPQVILPGTEKKDDDSRRMVNLEGMTGLMHTMAAYPLGKGKFSTGFGVVWNKIVKRDGTRLVNGEDGDYYQFPIALTYSAEDFEFGLQLPFESYDIFAPVTYNFRDGEDSGMGDASLRLKFSSQNDNMASCLGFGAIFPTSDRKIGNDESDNAWELFGGVSTKRKEGGNFHLNCGYEAGSGNTAHEGVFVNVGFEYAANESFTFMGEVNAYNRVNNGRSTDLTLGLRYFVKPGMAVSLAAPIALSNDMFFGYDYRLEGQLQYHY
ncbi:MAG TPA: LysM peptidoglycan-binding domain-containing protein [Candidatus Ozemobacteraceae bacterium]